MPSCYILDAEGVRRINDGLTRLDQLKPGRVDGGRKRDRNVPDYFVAYTGTGGLPAAASATVPSSAELAIYKLNDSAARTLTQVFNDDGTAFTKEIWNRGEAVAAEMFVDVFLDRFGIWWRIITVGGGELVWFRVESTGSNRLDPGGSATAFRQEWATSVYQTPAGSPVAETIYDISDASAFFGQNFVLPGELVPCMQSSVSGRLECVGSRGLRREGICTETGGIAIAASGEVTIRLDESTAAGYLITAANWDFIDESAIEEDNEVIVEFWPDRGEWVIVDRNC